VNCDAVVRLWGRILGRHCVTFPLDVTPQSGFATVRRMVDSVLDAAKVGYSL